jgi:hypothetical protein
MACLVPRVTGQRPLWHLPQRLAVIVCLHLRATPSSQLPSSIRATPVPLPTIRPPILVVTDTPAALASASKGWPEAALARTWNGRVEPAATASAEGFHPLLTEQATCC